MLKRPQRFTDPCARKLRLEPLEDRRMLAITVDTLLDVVDMSDGVTSLREAIADASPGETIDFSVTGEIDLTLGQLEVTKPLAINGPGAGLLTIDGQLQSRAFYFTATTGDFALAGVTITRGEVDNLDADDGGGGAIRFDSDGLLTISGTELIANRASGQNRNGGAIYASAGGVTLVDSVVDDNHTTGGHGGGVYVESGDVTLIRSTVTQNRSSGANDKGGGIFSGVGSVTLVDSTVSSNTSGNDGGGIHTSGDLSLTRSSVSGNAANRTIADGGGVFSSFGEVTITDSTISGNSAGENGGGIRTHNGVVTITRSTISGNSSGSLGGGIFTRAALLTIDETTVTQNLSGAGGGIHLDAGADQLLLNNSIVAGNTGTAPDIDRSSAPNAIIAARYSLIGDASGLPIDVLKGEGNLVDINPLLGPLADNGGPTNTHALLAGSPAINTGTPGNPTGALFDQRSGYPWFRVVDGRRDMGSFELTAQASDGTIPVDLVTDEFNNDYSPGDLSLREAIFLANTSGVADTIRFDPAVFSTPQTIALELGGLAITDSVTISGPGQDLLTIHALGSARVLTIDDLDNDNPSSVAISGLTLTGGRTTGSGGGIFSAESLSLDSVTVTGNDATTANSSRGGGVHFNGFIDTHLTITDSTITNNTSAHFGGGLSTSLPDDLRASVTVTRSTIAGNSAAAEGGGVFNRNGRGTSFVVVDSTIHGNIASGDGGGVHTRQNDDDGHALELINSTVSGNFSDGPEGGGGVHVNRGVARIANSTITRNTINLHGNSGSGGGVFGSTAARVIFDHTIVAANDDFSPASAPDVSHDFDAHDVAFTLIGDNTGTNLAEAPLGSPDANGNLIGQPSSSGGAGVIDPMLGLLAHNGGSTQTHALLTGSPAIHAGDPNFDPNDPDGDPQTDDALPFDQRGTPFVRVHDSRIDIGSFELQPAAPVNPGDFNNDLRVDAMDYAVWREHLGESDESSIAFRGDGLDGVDEKDFDLWLRNYGAAYAAPASTPTSNHSQTELLSVTASADSSADDQVFRLLGDTANAPTRTPTPAPPGADPVTPSTARGRLLLLRYRHSDPLETTAATHLDRSEAGADAHSSGHDAAEEAFASAFYPSI